MIQEHCIRLYTEFPRLNVKSARIYQSCAANVSFYWLKRFSVYGFSHYPKCEAVSRPTGLGLALEYIKCAYGLQAVSSFCVRPPPAKWGEYSPPCVGERQGRKPA